MLEVGNVEVIKSDLLTQLSAGTGLKQAADQSNRIKISEVLLKLEPQNPTGESISFGHPKNTPGWVTENPFLCRDPFNVASSKRRLGTIVHGRLWSRAF